MKRWPVFLVAIVMQGVCAAQEIHSFHCQHGCPRGAPTSNDLLVRALYTASSNGETKLVDWVAYVVTKETIGPSQYVDWRADPWLAENETLEPVDYQYASFDCAQLVPLESFTNTSAWQATKYVSVSAPQHGSLSFGLWKQLEQKVRALAQQTPVYVMAGPVYEREMPQLPAADEPHRVPSGYWQIISVQQGDLMRVAAFFFDQETASTVDLVHHLTTVDEIEEKTGLDFFWEQANEQLERTVNTAWAYPLFGATVKAAPVMKPTPTPKPAATQRSCIPRSQCCKICSKGRACGNTCVSARYRCHKGKGCACNYWEVCR